MIVIMDEHLTVAWLCKELGVSRIGLWGLLQRQQIPGLQALERAALMAQLEAVIKQHHGF